MLLGSCYFSTTSEEARQDIMYISPEVSRDDCCVLVRSVAANAAVPQRITLHVLRSVAALSVACIVVSKAFTVFR